MKYQKERILLSIISVLIAGLILILTHFKIDYQLFGKFSSYLVLVGLNFAIWTINKD